LSGAWQTISYVESEKNYGVGIGTQSVLWSDAKIFSEYSEAGGNALMFATTQFALNLLKELKIENPVKVIEEIFEPVHQYAKKITNNPDLRETFTLNALVSFDNALWILYAKEKGKTDFFEMIPEEFRKPLSFKHNYVACIPLISYSITLEEIEEMLKEGFFVLKIKIGSDPQGNGDREKMLEWDMERIKSIHEKFSRFETPFTENGKLPYYFDANGRYDTKERLWKLIDFMEKIGALQQVAIIEEPFPEKLEIDVSEFPVRIVADESAHTDKDVLKRAEMGYKGVALKPIAKTLSMTLKILKVAEEKNLDYFCADLTVIPVLVEWNKCLASRLKPLEGIKIPIVESNGYQYYKNWEKLIEYHPYPNAKWVRPQNGIFILNDEFFEKSGGIFDTSQHYLNLVKF
ncbi:L-alanine-DL-glutamate epimerase, partial [bacterium]|nr:L-alanine-DL-glutamate epimerase [bacterium]